MNKTILSSKDINSLVKENRYKVNQKTWFLSRCIDGRYENKEDLEALALPGADLGEIMVILATCLTYGYDYDLEKIFQVLVEIVGGEENLRTHTDSHADKNNYALGCGHFKQASTNQEGYDLGIEELKKIKKIFAEKLEKKYGEKTYQILHGDHLEGAVLLLEGEWGVYPQYQLETKEGKKLVEVFVYHKSLVEKRRKLIAKKLLEKKAISFRDGENEEMLVGALNNVGENHLMETAKRLAKGLPIYRVVFQDNGDFKIEELGNV